MAPTVTFYTKVRLPRLTRYAYDAVGNIVSKAEGIRNHLGQAIAERTTAYEYDTRHRLIHETYAAASGSMTGGVEYFYDAIDPGASGATVGAKCGRTIFDPRVDMLNGRLSWVRHGAGATYYSYNEFGQPIATYEQEGADFDICMLRVTRTTYDAVGRRRSQQLPSGRTIRHVYGAEDLRASSIEVLDEWGYTISGGPVLTGITYDVDGRAAAWSAGTVTLAATNDLSGQAQLRAYTEVNDHDFDWTITERDGSGNILGVQAGENQMTLKLTYDGQDRLITADGDGLRGLQECNPATGDGFTYDGTGNRLSESCGGPTVTYGYADPSSNELTSVEWLSDGGSCGSSGVNSRAIARDTLGRATTGYPERYSSAADAFTMVYGANGRLMSVTAAGSTWHYTYDHRNLRRSKSDGTTTTWFTYDQGGNLIAEEKTGAVTKEYVRLSGQLTLMVEDDGSGPELYPVGVDHLGTPMRLWDFETGRFVWAADYEVFGRAHEYVPGGRAAPVVNMPIRFPGQYEDDETGLHYNGWRYYEPNTGRYLSEEPLVTGAVQFANRSVQLTGRIPTLQGYTYAFGMPLTYLDANALYGTSSCDYYAEQCYNTGDFYSCYVGGPACEVFPKPDDPDPDRDDDYEGRSRCTRKCLQDCDKSCGGPVKCHLVCFDECNILTGTDGLTRDPF